MSRFQGLSLLPEDPILRLPTAYARDPNPQKVNLGVGSYRTAEGNPLVLQCVKEAEFQLLSEFSDKEYLPIEGFSPFIRAVLQLIFGVAHTASFSEHLCGVQTIGGAGALRLAGEFLVQLGCQRIFIPHPSWINHSSLFKRAGLLVSEYPYFDFHTRLLDEERMIRAISEMPYGSAILLHACCHNPTGADPSLAHWQALSSLIAQRQLIPLFDMAYQGFGESIEEDRTPIHLFATEGHELLVAYSCSKNFCLYGERVGLLALSTSSPTAIPAITSQLKHLIRSSYSNPPRHGAQIVANILSSRTLMTQWQAELDAMRCRIEEMRHLLASTLSTLCPSLDFSYVRQQRGLFCFPGFTSSQVSFLIQQKGIYIPDNGRLNLAGLNSQNLPYVADALASLISTS